MVVVLNFNYVGEIFDYPEVIKMDFLVERLAKQIDFVLL